MVYPNLFLVFFFVKHSEVLATGMNKIVYSLINGSESSKFPVDVKKTETNRAQGRTSSRKKIGQTGKN